MTRRVHAHVAAVSRAACLGAVVAASPARVSRRRSTAQAARQRRVRRSTAPSATARAGKGDGPRRATCVPRPRDFTAGRYKIRTTETGSVPTDDDLMRIGAQGPATARRCPAWETLLSDAEIRDVVSYIKTFSPRFATRAAAAGRRSAPASPTLARQRRARRSGLRQAAVRQVPRQRRARHRRGRDDVRGRLEQPLRAADLTEPWTFRGGATARDIYMRFRTGMSGTPMPSFKDAATDAEMWDLANYVVSLARKPVWADERRGSRGLLRASRTPRRRPIRSKRGELPGRHARLRAVPFADRRAASG